MVSLGHAYQVTMSTSVTSGGQEGILAFMVLIIKRRDPPRVRDTVCLFSVGSVLLSFICMYVISPFDRAAR